MGANVSAAPWLVKALAEAYQQNEKLESRMTRAMVALLKIDSQDEQGRALAEKGIKTLAQMITDELIQRLNEGGFFMAQLFCQLAEV